MTYKKAKVEIPKILKTRKADKVRKGMIDSILRAVAKNEGDDMANALITLFDLNIRGGHRFFDVKD
jgi:hypothetical protein